MSAGAGFEALSDDAKSVGLSFFPTIDSRATFHMEVSGPSKRSQAALDELLAKGLITKEVHDRRSGACTYRPTVSFGTLGGWQAARLFSGELEANSFNLWEKLPEKAD